MQQNEQKINLSVTIEELNVIFAGLEEVPHKYSRKVIDSLSQQAQSQVKQSQSQGQINQPPLAGITQKIN